MVNFCNRSGQDALQVGIFLHEFNLLALWSFEWGAAPSPLAAAGPFRHATLSGMR